MGKRKFEFPFTKLPNEFVDRHLKNLSGSETKVFLLILRKTVGWKKLSDIISLSQFKSYTGNSIPTIRKALKGLRNKDLIIRKSAGKGYRYTINTSLIPLTKNRSSSDKHERFLQGNGKESYHETSKKFTTQKKNKKIELNTTNCKRTVFRNLEEITQEKVFEIIDEWNNKFDRQINEKKQYWRDIIRKVLCYFSSDELTEAMQNRLNSDFYKNSLPLLHNPKCFFPWLETIENDLNRQSSRFYTYEEKADLIYLNGYDDNEFERVKDLIDEQGRAKWRLKNQ